MSFFCLRSTCAYPIGWALETGIRLAGSDDFARRIRAMGIYPGAHIEVMNRPFFNDSLVVKVDGCLLIVRKQEADCVTVEPVMHKKEW